MLTVGSLFSGIGGIDLGLELAGMRVRWQVEIDPWCQRVLEKHWPNVDRYEDVREVGAHNLERVDVIAGGFPCQDISDAGKRGGITAARSGLWREFARIIRELEPSYVLVENVSALRLRGLDVVLRDLSASGYDAEWDCVPAAAVGAPHIRDRIWIMAYPEGQRRRDGFADGSAVSDAHGGRLEERAELYGEAEQAAANGHSRGEHADGLRNEVADPSGIAARTGQEPGSLRSWKETSGRGWWKVEPAVGRVVDGLPGRVDRLRGLGNAVVPQVVEWIGRRIVEAEKEVAA